MPVGMFNFQQQTGYATPSARVSGAATSAAAQSYAALNEAVHRTGAALVNVSLQYGEKNRDLTQKADESAWNTFLKTELAGADSRASKLHDAAEIEAVYDGFYTSVESYIDGQNDSGGANVRSESHRAFLREQLPTFRMLADNHRETRRQASQSEQNAAKFENRQQIAVRQGDVQSAADAAKNLAEVQGLAPDAVAMNVRDASRSAELGRVDIRRQQIAAVDDPQAADDLATDFEADLKDGAFEFLTPDDKTKVLANVRGEAARVKRRAAVAEAEAQRAVNREYVRWQLDNPGQIPTVQQGREMGLADEDLLALQKAQRKADAAAKKSGHENEYAMELHRMIRAYDPATDADGEQAAQISLALAELPDAKRGFFKQAFETKFKKADAPAEKNDVSELQSAITDRLMDLVAAANVDGRNEFKGGRYKKTKTKKGEKAGEFYGELSVAAAQVQSMVDSYVKRNNPSVDELTEWYQTNPAIQQLRTDLELKSFLVKIPAMLSETPDAPGLSELLNKYK